MAETAVREALTTHDLLAAIEELANNNGRARYYSIERRTTWNRDGHPSTATPVESEDAALYAGEQRALQNIQVARLQLRQAGHGDTIVLSAAMDPGCALEWALPAIRVLEREGLLR